LLRANSQGALQLGPLSGSGLVAVHGAVEAKLPGEDDGVPAAVDTELGQDPGDMDADGLAADEQGLGDLPVGAALDQQA
jgi:hypothetical protein